MRRVEPDSISLSTTRRTPEPLPQPQWSNRTLNHDFGAGTCTFSPRDQILSVSVNGGDHRTGRLHTPIFNDGRPGTYLSMFCGESRTLIFTDHSIIVTLGRDAVMRGDTELPGRGDNAVARHTDLELGAPAVADTAGIGGEFAARLAMNGRLYTTDVTTRDVRITDVSTLLEFPISRQHMPHMHHAQGHLYILQEGSVRVIELDAGAGMAPGNWMTCELSAPCTGTPSFSERGTSVIVRFGSIEVEITPGISISETVIRP